MRVRHTQISLSMRAIRPAVRPETHCVECYVCKVGATVGLLNIREIRYVAMLVLGRRETWDTALSQIRGHEFGKPVRELDVREPGQYTQHDLRVDDLGCGLTTAEELPDLVPLCSHSAVRILGIASAFILLCRSPAVNYVEYSRFPQSFNITERSLLL